MAHANSLIQQSFKLRVLLFFCLITASSVFGAKQETRKEQAALEQFSQVNSVFIPNQGQWKDEEIRFAMNSVGANVGLTDNGPRIQIFRPGSTDKMPGVSKLQSPDGRPARETEMREIRASFQGAQRVIPTAEDKTDETFNYMLGGANDRHQNVPSFSTVWYKQLYSGIDLEVKGRRTGIKYNFHVAPGADWRLIRLQYDNIQKLSIRADGSLQIDVARVGPRSLMPLL